ncbi:MAG: immunity 26/phosphotriesterase HocA family protein [Acidobacteria bacterium]|nr:immunity 26/phosphotriesterase HocA family protein [Acidobacteriota bacterium]
MNEFAFGRILADVGRLRPQADLHRNHGLWNIMTKPVLVTIYGHIAASSNANLDEIMKSPKLPSDYIMDNRFFFGEYQIVGHRDLVSEDLDFPMSYGGTLRKSPNVFLQWGLIHKELSRTENTWYLTVRNDRVPAGNPNEIITNPYGYYGIGFRTRYDAEDVRRTSELGRFDYDNSVSYSARLDLRNPRNSRIRADLMNEFGLRPDLDYVENCGLTGTMNVEDLLKILNSRPNSRSRN